MSRSRTRVSFFVAALLAGVAVANVAEAEGYPRQRVTIVVPFGAGSGTDIVARIYAEQMAHEWNQNVIVENRPGVAGTASVARAAPDGYTLMVTSSGHLLAKFVSKEVSFDPLNDFTGITRLGSLPLVLISSPGLPAKTLGDLMRLAKTQPGQLNFSSPGMASTTFAAGALFGKAAGLDIVHVPFRSAPDAITAVIRGDVQLCFSPVNLVRDQAEAGKVRILAVATAQRVPDIPDVPTFTEAGLPFVFGSWFGLMAPAAVPNAILGKIDSSWAEASKSADVRAKLQAQFLIPESDARGVMDKEMRREFEEFRNAFN
jgi:tripartite-type tricarboxylate transporter receptor subunit TctC